MHIAGIQKTTLLDYPNKVAALIFTPGCNMRCHFCYNAQFVLPEKLKETFNHLIDEQAFFNFLDARSANLDGVVICGGEPTLQTDLYDFICRIKEKGFLVKLDTNGRDPDMIQKLITYKLVDYIAMDVKYPLDNLDVLTGVKEDRAKYQESIDILRQSSIEYEFRTTIIGRYHTPEVMHRIGHGIQWAKLYALQNYIPGKTLNPTFDGLSYAKEDMQRLEEIVAPYVQKTLLRI
jgi:pyruvate formate lyase activating enzyme